MAFVFCCHSERRVQDGKCTPGSPGRRDEPRLIAVPDMATTAAMTIMPPAKLEADGASLKQTHTQVTASGVSSVFTSAVSVGETLVGVE